MKKQNLILSILSLTFLLTVSSCGDDEVGKASKEEVRAAFQDANTQISTNLNSFNSTSGSKAMNSLSVLTEQSDPFGRKSSEKREQVIENFKAGVLAIRGILVRSTTNARLQGDEPFDFNANKGIYAWNSQQQTWIPAGESQIIEIRFPTEGANSSTNDAVFKLTAYDEEQTPNGDELYSPTLIKASISVSGTKELELDAEVEYGDEDEPVKGDLYYFVNPFALEVEFDDTKSKSSSFSETLSKSGTVLIGFGASVNYNDSEKNEQNITSISGYIQLLDVKLTVSAKASDATEANPYDAVKISIKVKNKVGGKIFLQEDASTGEPVPYVKYNDGSTELLEDLLDISLEIESMLR